MCDNSHCNKDTNKLLIDFNGPSQTQLDALNPCHLIPLVPSSLGSANCPNNTLVCSQTILDDNDSDVDNNPFDLVVHQTNLNMRILNDPFELVYQKAYHLQTDTSCEVYDGSAHACVTNVSITEVHQTPLPSKTVTALQETGNTTIDNLKGNTVHSNDVVQVLENLNDSIFEFSREDSSICIEDITDPTGHMYLSLSDASDASKQSSAVERRTESGFLNITNTSDVYQAVKGGSGIFGTKLVEAGQGIGENNSFLDVRNSVCSAHNGKQNCFSAGCRDGKAATHVLSQCQGVTINSNSHTDEELKAIVTNRISACIKNALGQSKLSTRENDVSDPSLSSDITSCTQDMPQMYSSHEHVQLLSFASPAAKKSLTSTSQIRDMNASAETFQIMFQQGKTNSVNTGLASDLKTCLDSLKMSTQRGSSSSTGSVDSYGELNKAFYANAVSPAIVNSPPDHLYDGSFSYGIGVCDTGAVEKSRSRKCINVSSEANTVFTISGNEVCCSSSSGCKTVRADGRDVETITQINGMFDEQTAHSARTHGVQKENTDQRKCEYMNLFREKSMNIDKNMSTCSTSDINDYVTGNMCVRRAMSSSWCAGSSISNKNGELSGDDSLFMEANTLAFVFSKVADSFTQLNSSDGEEDIVNCKPQWEISQLNLPRFNSEEDGADQVEEYSLQTGAETKKDVGERSKKTGSPVNDMTPDYRYRHKKSSAQKKFDVNKKRGCSSASSESPASSHSSKWSSGSCSGASTPPLSKQKIQGLSLHTGFLPSVGKKLNREVPNVILPPSLSLMNDKAEKDVRLKPKRKQEVGKRGPMKAVVPVDSMTRASGIQKEVVQAAGLMLKYNSEDIITSTPKPLVRSLLNHKKEANNTPTAKKTGNPAGVSLLESKKVAVTKDSFGINRSFTALSSPTCAPILRRSSSLTSGIMSLALPSATVLNQPSSCFNNDITTNSKENSKSLLNIQPPSPICKQSARYISTPAWQQKGKSSSSIPQFNLSGLAVTSTPTRKGRHTSPSCSTLKCLASPIPIRDVKEKTSLQAGASESVKTVAMPSNRSVDSIRQKEETKSVPKHHGRSKSVSSMQLQKEEQTAQMRNHCDKSTIFGKGAKKDHSNPPIFQTNTSKLMVMKNLSNQCVVSKGNQKVDLSSPVAGNDQKGPQSVLQMYLQLKRSAVEPVGKENLNPSCKICL